MRPLAAEVISIQRLICTGCGAETNATCNCGMEYRPKAARAREAIEANPEKSNRAIAGEIGSTNRTSRFPASAQGTINCGPVRSSRAHGPRRQDAEDARAQGAGGDPTA